MSAARSSWIRRPGECFSRRSSKAWHIGDHRASDRLSPFLIASVNIQPQCSGVALLNSSWNISHKILYWLFKTDRKPRSHVVSPWDRIFFQRYFRFLAVAQNFNCVTNNFPRFQANAEKLDILFYQNIVLYTLKIEIETVHCSFLGFRPSGDRVLPLPMRYASQSCLRAWHAESGL